MAIHFDGWLRKNYGAHYDVFHVAWLTVYRVAKDGIGLYSLLLFALQISESTKKPSVPAVYTSAPTLPPLIEEPPEKRRA